MNKLIEPASLLEVREWKRRTSALIRREGLASVESKGMKTLGAITRDSGKCTGAKGRTK